MRDLSEQILSLISKKGVVTIEEIQARFNITEKTANMVIDFLVKFGFAEFDANNGHIGLTETLREFFDETDS